MGLCYCVCFACFYDGLHFHGVSRVSYQYNLSIYTETCESVVMLTPTTLRVKEGKTHSYHIESIWNDPAGNHTCDLLYVGVHSIIDVFR